MTLWMKVVLVVGLEVGLGFFAAYLVQRTFNEALKGVKLALKSEVSTHPGRLNLAGVIIFAFLIIFLNLHESLANALSTEKPAPSDLHVIAPLALFGLVFIGSLICVLIMERQGPPER